METPSLKEYGMAARKPKMYDWERTIERTKEAERRARDAGRVGEWAELLNIEKLVAAVRKDPYLGKGTGSFMDETQTDKELASIIKEAVSDIHRSGRPVSEEGVLKKLRQIENLWRETDASNFPSVPEGGRYLDPTARKSSTGIPFCIGGSSARFLNFVDPKDKSAILQEQGRELTCNPNLMDLRKWLKEQIADERKAHGDYSMSAAEMADMGLPVWKEALNSLAEEEGQHQAILGIIVDVITEKCGE